MFVKVEPTGCCERKGLVQVRFCVYLEEGDYNYEKHYVQVYERPLTEKELVNPKLAELVPKVWQNNPFHNHFIYVEPETPDETIMDIGQAVLEESYIEWACDERPKPKNPKFEYPVMFDKAKVEAKVQHLKETVLERYIGSY